jgi:hypothetical protein
MIMIDKKNNGEGNILYTSCTQFTIIFIYMYINDQIKCFSAIIITIYSLLQLKSQRRKSLLI